MNNKENIPKELCFKGPTRHSKVFKEEFMRLFPIEMMENMEKINIMAEEKENKESILFTPHPIDYNDPVNFE